MRDRAVFLRRPRRGLGRRVWHLEDEPCAPPRDRAAVLELVAVEVSGWDTTGVDSEGRTRRVALCTRCGRRLEATERRGRRNAA